MKGIGSLMTALIGGLMAAPLWAASLNYQVAGGEFEGYVTKGRAGEADYSVDPRLGWFDGL